MADFEPDFASSHFLLLETVFLPFSLLRRVWPELDHWLDIYLERPGTKEKVEQNLAAGEFLELLDKLRMVLLQVSNGIFIILL